MERRNFFKTTVLAGGIWAIAPLNSCMPASVKNAVPENYSDFDLNEITISQLQEKMKSGDLTSEEITRKYLHRIGEIDKNGPQLRSVIEVNPEAMKIARKLDNERKEGKIRGPLHGIPVLVKDNIDTGDKMLTTAGSHALTGSPAPDDAFIIRKLRDAGAVLLGKTNLSEWANFRSTHSSSGWSGRGGQVRNPYITYRSPCGSSSGTGVAVSANLCAIGVGTETDGSIVCPSGINGIVGIKPTLGLWSRDGIIPISHSQDTAGPMARTVTDAAILLGLLSGADASDPETGKAPANQDFTRFLDSDGLKGARIGVAANFMGFKAEVDQLITTAILSMKSKGSTIVENLKFENQQEWGKLEWQVLITEFKVDLNNYLKTRKGLKVKTLADLIEFNIKNTNTELKWFGQEIFEEAEKTRGLDDPAYREALAKVKELTQKQGIDLMMDKHQLDALIAPTNGPSWAIDLVNGDHFGGGSSEAAAISGYPAITVPAGFVQGLPIGISFFGRAWSEPTLIKLAYAFEQATKHRKAPGFLKGIE